MDNLNEVDFDNFEAVGRGSFAETKNDLDKTALDAFVVSEKKGNSFQYFDYLYME